MGRDPLSADEDVMAETFYGAASGQRARVPVKPVPTKSKGRSASRRRPKKATPTHYKIVSISLYNEDIARIDTLVTQLKDNGFSKANRSALIRYAIDTVDISKVPRGY